MTTVAPSLDGGSDLAERVTRYGWIAKGGLFIVIGVLGFELARRGYSTEDADQRGALQVLADLPAGRVLVGVVGAGLLLFAVWNVVLAVTRENDDILAVLKRFGWAGLGLAYGLLGVTALQIALDPGSENASSGGSSVPKSPAAISRWVFEFPGGRVVIAAVGVVAAAIGLYHLRKGWRRDFLDDIDTPSDPATTKALTILGVAGFTARALVLVVVGWLFVQAAWTFDASEAGGLDQSLRVLVSAPFGRIVVLASSLGLMAAGVYDLITYRRQRLD